MKSGYKFMMASTVALKSLATLAEWLIITESSNIDRIKDFFHSLSLISVKRRNLTREEEKSKGYSFEVYEPSSSSCIHLQIENVNSLLSSIKDSPEVPREIVETLKAASCCSDTHKQITLEPSFTVNLGGRYLYAYVLAKKTDGKLDVAYSFSSLKFKLKAEEVETREVKYFLGLIPWGEAITVKRSARYLYEQDLPKIRALHKTKVVDQLRSKIQKEKKKMERKMNSIYYTDRKVVAFVLITILIALFVEMLK